MNKYQQRQFSQVLTGLHYWSWLPSASLYEGLTHCPENFCASCWGIPASLTLGLAMWCALAEHVCNVKGAMSEQKHRNALSDSVPNQKTQGLSSRLQQFWSQPVIPKNTLKKEIIVCVVSSWEWEDHYFIQADWFKFLVQKEICKKLAGYLWEKKTHWFWSDFLKIQVVKPRGRESVETSNIHYPIFSPQTESLKLTMTLRVTLAK